MSNYQLYILLTSVGNLASPTVQEYLRREFKRIKIIGTDIRIDAHGLYFCDKGYLVPRLENSSFLNSIINIIKSESINCIFPLSTSDQNWFSERKEFFEKELNVKVVCSSKQWVTIANDKLFLYDTLSHSLRTNCVNYFPISVKDIEVIKNFPIPFVLKKRKSTGGAGTYIVATSSNELCDQDKKFFLYLSELEQNFSKYVTEDTIICEYLPGEEYSVDVLSQSGKILYGIVRKRYTTLGGMTIYGEVVDEKEIMKVAEEVLKIIKLDYINNIQIRRSNKGVPKIMEINPRIPGTIKLSIEASGNMIADAIKLALGMEIQIPKKILYGTAIFRYWDGKVVRPIEKEKIQKA